MFNTSLGEGGRGGDTLIQEHARLKFGRSNHLSGLFTYCSFWPEQREHTASTSVNLCTVHHIKPHDRQKNKTKHERQRTQTLCLRKIQLQSAQNFRQRPARPPQPPLPLTAEVYRRQVRAYLTPLTRATDTDMAQRHPCRFVFTFDDFCTWSPM